MRCGSALREELVTLISAMYCIIADDADAASAIIPRKKLERTQP